MSPAKRRLALAGAGLVALAIVLWIAVFRMPVIQPHVGDGKFENHSWRFPWISVGLPVPGYTIEFNHFDLANPYDSTYSVGRLPQIDRRPYIYLCIKDSNRLLRSDEDRKRLTAKVQIDITDSKGQSVCHVQQPLAKMYWAGDEGG